VNVPILVVVVLKLVPENVSVTLILPTLIMLEPVKDLTQILNLVMISLVVNGNSQMNVSGVNVIIVCAEDMLSVNVIHQ
jgi:hypothetical protein